MRVVGEIGVRCSQMRCTLTYSTTLMCHISVAYIQSLQSIPGDVRRARSFRRVLYHDLKELGHKKAFVGLVRAISSEYAAMWNSGIFCVEDIMNLMMNIHVRTCVNELEQQLNKLER